MESHSDSIASPSPALAGEAWQPGAGIEGLCERRENADLRLALRVAASLHRLLPRSGRGRSGFQTSILPFSSMTAPISIPASSPSSARIISLCALPDGIIGKQFSF